MSALAGVRVVVTRAGVQASALVELLAAKGAVPVEVPLLEIVDEPPGVAALAELDLGAFAWVVVTSANGAARLPPVPPTVHVAAVGSATAAALGRVDLVPAVQSAAGLLAQMPAGTGQVLVVQAVDAAPDLVAGLGRLGWRVQAVAPYRSRPCAPSAEQAQAAQTADAVLFASGSAAAAWVQAFGPQAPPIVVAIGPQTAAAAAACGLKISLVATDHSLAGMVAALERHLSTDQ